MLKKSLLWNKDQDIDQIAHSLLQGCVVVGTSDTVLGLLANTTQLGFNTLSAIKQRNHKPYIILIDNIDKLKHFAQDSVTDSVHKLLQTCWPGPLTVLLTAKHGLPDFLQSEDGKIALRIPKHAGLLKLLANFEGLFSTSANLAGEHVPALASELNIEIVNKIDLVILDHYNQSSIVGALPSTILDLSTGDVKLIRAGAYAREILEQIYGSSFLDSLNKS